jgi:hypothetical protein
MKTLVVQSYRTHDVPAWIGRCLVSVKAWADLRGYDYLLTDDSAFALCGPEYLARVGDNKRSITNLCRLELLRRAHSDGYDRAVWVDADVFVCAPDRFTIDHVGRYAFARETFIYPAGGRRWIANSTVNNCTIVVRRGEPDLDFLIVATRHVAMHRQIRHNFQVGVNLVKGLHNSLDYELLDNVGMFGPAIVLALAAGNSYLLNAQARLHGTPVFAMNLCAATDYRPSVSESNACAAIDALERTAGGIVNDWLDGATTGKLPPATQTTFEGPDVATLAVAA